MALAAKDVESWATSSLASRLAFEESLGDPRRRRQPCDVQLPLEAILQAVDHLRYEAADVVYHLMVVLERYGIDLDEFAAELNHRMTEGERPQGGRPSCTQEHARRGK